MSDPFALFEDRFAADGQPAAWWFKGFVQKVQGDWAALFAAIETARQHERWAVVALDYELGLALEPALAGLPCSAEVGTVWVFSDRQELTAQAADSVLEQYLSTLDESSRTAGIASIQPAWTEAQHAAAVDAVQAYIRAGDCYQVNLTFPLDFEFFGHPLALYSALRARQPARYGGLILDSEAAIVSLSPELFVECSGKRLRTRPMKGTAARGGDELTDEQQATGLAQSTKNRAENLMIVDLLRNDLARLHLNGVRPQVSVSELFALEAYPSVWQMVSEVNAEFPEAVLSENDSARVSPDVLLSALFPCGSITGAPKIRAMQIIQELEPAPRALYTGSLGWFAPNGDCRLNVAIRTLSLNLEGEYFGRGRLGVGGGIVQDSQAADEWAECWLKARFLTELDPSIRLIETMRLNVSEGAYEFPFLKGHLARLSRSAGALGFACDVDTVQAALNGLAKQQTPGTWRVRLTLDKFGQCSVESFALLPEPDLPRCVTLATHRVDARHPLQRHKTTWRQHYDRALAEISHQPEIFDVLFFNQEGELAEGARSSVLVLREGVWLTPSVSSGALPGVWRAEVLAGNVPEFWPAQEAVLRLDDLQQAEKIVCGNALRGAQSVTFRA